MSTSESPPEENNHSEEALQLLEDGKSRELSALLESLHPVELGSLLSSVEQDQQALLLKHVYGLDHLSNLISYADGQLAQRLLAHMDDSRVAAVARRLEIDEAADIIGALPRRRQVSVLRRLSTSRAREILSLVAYDQATAGGIMTTEFVAVAQTKTSEEVLTDLRKRLRDSEIGADTNLQYLYIIDEQERLIGVTSLRELLSIEPNTLLSELASEDLLVVSPDDDQERVAELTRDYALSAIPVIAPENGKILGIITVDDVIDVIEEEATEDLLKLAGTEEQDVVSATVSIAFKARMPWLLVSWMGGVSGALLLGSFEATLSKYVHLAFFMPVVFGMGGNVGSQSSTITVRGLATGELAERKFAKRVRKEALVGLLLGITFGILLGLAAYILFSDRQLSMIVAASITMTMTAASAMGSLLPVAFKRFGFDPAVSSGPLVTTMTDIMSIVVYFTIATIMLGIS
jgi:magnesium transporter